MTLFYSTYGLCTKSQNTTEYSKPLYSLSVVEIVEIEKIIRARIE